MCYKDFRKVAIATGHKCLQFVTAQTEDDGFRVYSPNAYSAKFTLRDRGIGGLGEGFNCHQLT